MTLVDTKEIPYLVPSPRKHFTKPDALDWLMVLAMTSIRPVSVRYNGLIRPPVCLLEGIEKLGLGLFPPNVSRQFELAKNALSIEFSHDAVHQKLLLHIVHERGDLDRVPFQRRQSGLPILDRPNPFAVPDACPLAEIENLVAVAFGIGFTASLVLSVPKVCDLLSICLVCTKQEVAHVRINRDNATGLELLTCFSIQLVDVGEILEILVFRLSCRISCPLHCKLDREYFLWYWIIREAKKSTCDDDCEDERFDALALLDFLDDFENLVNLEPLEDLSSLSKMEQLMPSVTI